MRLRSPFQTCTVWELGETKKVAYFTNALDRPFVISEKRLHAKRRDGWRVQVNAGLHSYSNKDAAAILTSVHQKAYKCTIPKGTRYIRGADHEVVSLALRLNAVQD
jgi:hypothetical protein